jgi:predicted alpha/beta-fold hydrolase
MPESGGHVGFVSFNRQNLYWSEKQAVDFLNRDGAEK